MNKGYDEWRAEIENKLEVEKRNFYQFGQKVSNSDAARLEKYFSDKGYWTEFRKCNACSGWDMIVTRK